MAENDGIALGELMPSKKPRVMVYLSEEDKTDLDKWAKEERRTVNNLITLLIEDALSKRRKKPRQVKEKDED